jgi:putative peptidoglycan lipid II flippase
MKNSTLNLSVTKRSFAAMFGVLLSRASGVIRTILVNAIFGANITMDAFNTAFRFPNSLRDLFADGALSAAFMKTLIDEKTKGFEEEKKLIGVVTGVFFTITLLLALLAVFYAKPFIALISNQLFAHSGGLILATHLFQMLAFYLPLTMLNAIVMAILGVHNMNFRAMNGSIFLSVGMIFGALVLTPLFMHYHTSGIYGLGVGALLGAVLQLIYQIMPVLKLKLFPIPCFNPKFWFHYEPLRRVLWMMAPRALGQGASTLALMINTFFAIQLGQGAMTYVATTIIIIQVPIGLFGVATGFASLPVLTESINRKDYFGFSKLFIDSIDITLWLSMFMAFAFALFVIPAYHLVFQHGKIQYADSLQNGLALCAYSTGIIFSTGSKVLINGLYALNRTWFIVYNSLLYLIVSTIFTAFLTPIFGLIGLGFAFGLASAANFWLNYYLVSYAFESQEFGISPFAAGGRYFPSKLLSFSGLSFALSILGIWLINNFWSSYTQIMGEPLTMKISASIVIFGGLLFSLITFLLTFSSGPAPLRQPCERLVARLFKKYKQPVSEK